MPEPVVILDNLARIANDWRPLAVFWHVYFALLLLGLLAGMRISRRVGGMLLSLPLFSVGTLAWVTANPVNGTVFILAGLLLFTMSPALGPRRVGIAPVRLIVAGGVMFAFGWVYPHFLETGSRLQYLYSAPVGLIPCPTLSIIIGMTLMLHGLHSRAWSMTIAGLGILYGLFGVLYLDVNMDGLLLVGALLLPYSIDAWPATGRSSV